MVTNAKTIQSMKSNGEKQSKSALVPAKLITAIRKFAKDNELLYDTHVAKALQINIKTLENVYSGRCSPKTIDSVKSIIKFNEAA